MGGTCLFLGEVLAVVRARGFADVAEPLLERGEGVRHECDAERQGRVGRGGAGEREAGGDVCAGLVQLGFVGRRCTEDERGQGDDEQSDGDHRV